MRMAYRRQLVGEQNSLQTDPYLQTQERNPDLQTDLRLDSREMVNRPIIVREGNNQNIFQARHLSKTKTENMYVETAGLTNVNLK